MLARLLRMEFWPSILMNDAEATEEVSLLLYIGQWVLRYPGRAFPSWKGRQHSSGAARQAEKTIQCFPNLLTQPHSEPNLVIISREQTAALPN